jgi:hypothetical protein
MLSRAIAQAISWLPPRRPGFDPRSGHVRFMVDEVALGQVFSEYFGFHCQTSFHQPLHNHHRSSGAGLIGQQWPTYQVDSVSPHPGKLKKKNTMLDWKLYCDDYEEDSCLRYDVVSSGRSFTDVSEQRTSPPPLLWRSVSDANNSKK